MKALFLVTIFATCRYLFNEFFSVRLSLHTRIVLPTACFLFVTGLLSCGTVQVYTESNQPVFHFQDKIPQATEQKDLLNVVTFNIKKAEKIGLAAAELHQLQQTTNVDVYLLQEMDEKGVKEIARQLNLNYLYIPVVYHTSSKKNVGNAILTKGAIECPEKLLLPHERPLSKNRRLVTIAEVTVQQKKILVYSVHTETVVMSRKKRMDQVDAIIQHAKLQLPAFNYVLIGGDFNTLFSKDGQLTVEKFNEHGFDWPTEAAGTTARGFLGLIKPRHDYIFTKGLEVVNTSRIESSKSSDHYPILATFRY